MAIIAGMNLIDQPWFDRIETIGNSWDDVEQLSTPALEPAARYAAQSGVVGVEFWSAGLPLTLPNCFALLGTDVGITDDGLSLPNIVLETWVGFWSPVSDFSVFELAAVGSPRHLVVVADQPVPGARWRLLWQANGRAGYVGAVYCGRAISHPQLADAGWRLRYVDDALRDRSADGQIYTGTAKVRRELRLEQSVLDAIVALSVPAHGDLIALPAPATTGSVVASGAWVSVGPSQQGTAQWPGAIAEGAFYRLDYEVRHAGDPVDGSRWALPSAVADLRTTEITGARGTLVFRAQTPATPPPLFQLSAGLGPGTSAFRILALSKVDVPAAAVGDGIDLKFSLRWLHAIQGASKPVIVMPFPSDPALNAVVGIYGYIQSPVDIGDRGEGRVFQSAMVIDEQR